MFENIVVGIDGLEGGREAVRLARTLASDTARVTIAHVYGDVLFMANGLSLASEREESAALVDRERDACWPEADTASVYCGAVGRGLHELARQRGADLLVVGSCRHGMLGRVLMGDQTRAAFNGAPCAIAIPPRGYSAPSNGLAVIAVGYDGSPDGDQALAAARDLAARSGARIEARWMVSNEDVRLRAPLPADWHEAGPKLVNEVQQRMAEIEGVHGVAVLGGPREELVKLSLPSDLLIVGSRGYGPFGSLFHGSVSSYLERHCGCPLLVVPRGSAHDSEPTLQRSGSQAVPA